MTQNTIFADLRNVLAYLYPDEPSVCRITSESGVDLSQIVLNSNPKNNWHSVLTEANKINQIDTLLGVVEREYGDNREFRNACNAYRRSIDPISQIDLHSPYEPYGRELQLVLDRDYDKYTQADQQLLLEAIHRLLKVSKGDIIITNVKRGSVLVSVKLPDDQIRNLINVVRANSLREHGVWKVDLRGANLSGVDLSRADLSEADLSNADLTRANLTETNLSRANLNGANLDETDLRTTILRNIKCNYATVWPEGFDHQKSEAISLEVSINQVRGDYDLADRPKSSSIMPEKTDKLGLHRVRNGNQGLRFLIRRLLPSRFSLSPKGRSIMKLRPLQLAIGGLIASSIVVFLYTRPPLAAKPSITVESAQNADFLVPGTSRRIPLPALPIAPLAVNEGVAVNETGRAVITFSDIFRAEVLREGKLQITEAHREPQSAIFTVELNAGVLLNEYDANQAVDHRFTVNTDFAQVVATGTRFLVVREAHTPLEWVIALDAQPGDLTVTDRDVQVAADVPSAIAAWVAPIDQPMTNIRYKPAAVADWLAGVQAGQPGLEIGDVLWDHADILSNTGSWVQRLAVGVPFTVTGVTLTLDARGLTQAASYGVRDCNGDGIQDLAVQEGRLRFDFRPLPKRVRQIDVTLYIPVGVGGSSLVAFNPANVEVGRDARPALFNQVYTLSVSTDQREKNADGQEPFHYAELNLHNGCFLGFSLTPPDPDGGPGVPRAVTDKALPPTPIPVTITPTPAPPEPSTITPVSAP